MAIVTGDLYTKKLVKFVDNEAEKLIEGTLVLKLNPVGLRYVQSRFEALSELESLLAGTPVDYLRAYVSDLGDHRALQQLRRILEVIPSLKVVSVLPHPARDPTPLFLLPFGRLKVLELRGCDLSTSAAKGLLELRFTLEKLICHNSTDVLRHVLVSRILEIHDSPQWNRLSFVSCACNNLVLMDESLQLLPVVETLDLSRNKFTKVDNLQKCMKLKHLDLGFNSLRSISSLSEVSCQIVKLVLRNNALTKLEGIENMKSLAGLDVSYNIISSFSEIEILAGLPSLQNLWLEGNPICCARWFRAQVFSLFPHAEKLELDEKKISAYEFWEQKVIVASRERQRGSFGFYSPAKYGGELGGSVNSLKRRTSRLATIRSDEQTALLRSESDSVSCDSEIRSNDGNAITDEEAEIEDFMKRIELLKKDSSDLWLQEFKEWLDQTSETVNGGTKFRASILNNQIHPRKQEDHIETSRYISDSLHHSGDESSSVILGSETSFADTSVASAQQFFYQNSEESSRNFLGRNRHVLKKLNMQHQEEDSWLRTHLGGDSVSSKSLISPSSAVIDDITSLHSVSASIGGSPPHFQEDILRRRNEIMELSAGLLPDDASSDSNTSSSEDECGTSKTQVNHSNLNVCVENNASTSRPEENSIINENGIDKLNPSIISSEDTELEFSTHGNSSGEFVGLRNGELTKKRGKRKPKKRMITLPEEEDVHVDTDSSNKSGDLTAISKSDINH